MNTLLQQLKNRRLDLGLKQNDMMLRVGVSRQQYQRLESKGNPRLDTLELIAKGLNSELMLIPKEKLGVVLAVLEGDAVLEPGFDKKNAADEWEADSEGQESGSVRSDQRSTSKSVSKKSLSDDPWQHHWEENGLGDDS
jgi:transcriptional regulator with XRE-family HTH domain